MRRLSFISFFLLFSCSQDYAYRWRVVGPLTTLRIDDDAEYHFSTDNNVFRDIWNAEVLIVRKDTVPTLFYRQVKCNSGICNSAGDKWEDVVDERPTYKIVIPENYKIETFDD